MSNEDIEKYIPPVPNLSGDDVMFVRYDPTNGALTSYGCMNRELITQEQTTGGHIVEVANHHIDLSTDSIDLNTKQLVQLEKRHAFPSMREAVEKARAHARLTKVRSELADTDKYFLSDALDNVTQNEQEVWRKYRQQLRAVASNFKLDMPERPKPHPKPEIVSRLDPSDDRLQ